MAKKYADIAGDGGSDVVGQLSAQAQRLQARMVLVRHKVAVMSGKGGVGKSAVAVNLAAFLASQGHSVGVLDADINSPVVAKMLGVRGRPLVVGQDGVSPAAGPKGVKVMSMDLALHDDTAPVLWNAPSQQNSFVWRGAMEASTLREFLADVDWGSLDFLVVDLPPGPDGLAAAAQLLPDVVGVVVTIPAAVSRLVVGRFIALARELKVPLAGLVENMSGYVCPHCGQEDSLFPDPGNLRTVANEQGLPYLGRVPFDPRLSSCTDLGLPFVLAQGDSPAAKELARIADKVRISLEGGRQ